jgi:hypothetical protein
VVVSGTEVEVDCVAFDGESDVEEEFEVGAEKFVKQHRSISWKHSEKKLNLSKFHFSRSKTDLNFLERNHSPLNFTCISISINQWIKAFEFRKNAPSIFHPSSLNEPITYPKGNKVAPGIIFSAKVSKNLLVCSLIWYSSFVGKTEGRKVTVR